MSGKHETFGTSVDSGGDRLNHILESLDSIIELDTDLAQLVTDLGLDNSTRLSSISTA